MASMPPAPTGEVPDTPTDPTLLKARQIAAKALTDIGSNGMAKNVGSGLADASPIMVATLAALQSS